MSNALVTQLDCGQMLKESEVGEYIPLQLVVLPNGTARGIAFPKVNVGNNTALGYLATFVIPPGLTITTGLEVYLNTTDDGAFAADLGNTTVFGVAVKKVTAANTNMSSAGTEVTATITMSANSGQLVQTIIQIPTADLNGAGSGDTICMRIRRVGTSTSDLCVGRILVPSAHVTTY
jgi:hypothetical protein